MSTSSIEVTCSDCGHIFAEEHGAAGGQQPPCPNCGSFFRHIDIRISEEIAVYDWVAAKGSRRPGKRKPYIEAIYGKPDWHRDKRRWSLRTKVINRADDEYHEVIKDLDTGEIVHECHEPLSQHTGHGSDRSVQQGLGLPEGDGEAGDAD